MFVYKLKNRKSVTASITDVSDAHTHVACAKTVESKKLTEDLTKHPHLKRLGQQTTLTQKESFRNQYQNSSTYTKCCIKLAT